MTRIRMQVRRPVLWVTAWAVILLVTPSVFAASYTLYVESGSHTMNGPGGDVVPVWGYTEVNGGAPQVPGPLLASEEGEAVSVTVVNHLSDPHNFVVLGLTGDTSPIAPGDSKTYNFSTPEAGVFRYSDTLADDVNREMGLFGALVVRAAGGGSYAWTGGPAYDMERLWVLSEVDKVRWNNVAAAGGTVDTSDYRPQIFLINGMTGHDGMNDAATVLEGNVGTKGIVRIVNAGLLDHSMHFHGNHYQILSVDGARLSQFEWGATINVEAGTTAMLLYAFEQSGVFPMHVHTAHMETSNGVYLSGVATMLVGH